jgi:hypothetical protein
MAENKDIKYLNKDFSTFKTDLIEYAKSYFPNSYNDFSAASPGTMFIEMAAYVGDVLSYYLDNQIQESFLQYAKQPNNLYTLAYMLGYRPKVTSAAVVDLDVYQTVLSVQSGADYLPDFGYALTIAEGMQVTPATDSSITFYVPDKIDFTMSSSMDPTEVSVYSLTGNNPDTFLLKKTVKAISGQVKSAAFDFGNSDRFPSITLQDSNIIDIISITDSDGNKWYEVPYLAQDYILNPVANIASNYPDLYQFNNQVPYMIEKLSVPRRFTTRFLSNGTMMIEFGSGIDSTKADNQILPLPQSASLGLTDSLTLMNTAFDPTNFVVTQTYGLVPKNTTLTVKYLAGGGANSNVFSNELNRVSSISSTSVSSPSRVNTVVVNNPSPAAGGGDGETIEELRYNILSQFPSQMRAVTQQDYMSRVISMPAKFGKISKVFVTKDDATFKNYINSSAYTKDQILISLYLLSYNSNGNLDFPSQALLNNVKTYLNEYKLLTDAINLKNAYIINIACNFEIVIYPNFSGQDVLARCIAVLKNYFNIGNWQINQPIVLSNVYSILDQVEGVQTVTKVDITNKVGEADGYSKYAYDIPGATLKGVIYPSLDPSIFEIKYPDTDIRGRVVAY